MSDANRVLWSEGLFLRPQHFQQQDRHTEALVRGALQAGQLHAWGFARAHARRGPARRRPRGGDRGPRHPARRHALRHPRGHGPARAGRHRPRHARRRRAAGAAAGDARRRELRPRPRRPPPAPATAAGSSGCATRCRAAASPRRSRSPVRPRCCSRRAATPAATSTLPVAELTGLRADGGVALREGFLPPALASGGGALLRPAPAGGRSPASTASPRRTAAWCSAAPGAASRTCWCSSSPTPPGRASRTCSSRRSTIRPSSSVELAGLAGRMATYGSGSRRLSELPAYDHLAPAPGLRRPDRHAALADPEPALRRAEVARAAGPQARDQRLDGADRQPGDARRQPHRGARRLRALRRRAAQDLRASGDGRLGRRVRRAVEVAPARHPAQAAALAAARDPL